jgi:hypothetical protein
VRSEPEKGRFEIEFVHGERGYVGFDGFIDGTFATPYSSRADHRRRAYGHLREATRLAEAGFAADARAESERAQAAATVADDPLLLESARRSMARLQVRLGEPEGSALFAELFADSARPGDIAFDAARAYHLRGDLERALEWYRAGMGPGSDGVRGRPMTEHFEGSILALAELGRLDEARREIHRFVATYPGLDQQARTLEKFVRWRAGDVPGTTDDEINYASPDLHRYWHFEFLLRRGGSPAELMPLVNRELLATSEARPMLLALAAELLDMQGDRAGAVALAYRARDEAEMQADRVVAVRAGLELIESRYQRITAAR